MAVRPTRQLPAALLLLLFVTCCSLCFFACDAVNVGESDAGNRHLLSAASGSGSGAGVDADGACPNATTIAVSSASTSAAQITTGGASCKRETVKSVASGAADAPRVLLDVRGKGIVVVKSVPADVQMLNLGNNIIESLEDASFPKTLLSLDLNNNSLATLEGAAFPSSLTSLNVSRNPITTLKGTKLPSTLLQLDLTRTKLTAVEDFSFPDALESLNLSGNALTKISGVAFSVSLSELRINAIDPVTASDSANLEDTAALFGEFEVRQSDADRFAKLKVFDVAATTKLICSDTRARRIYVKNTMLCVISDDAFLAKYGDINSESSKDSSGSGSLPLVVLDEDFDQSRSWFLVVAAAALGGFVACVFIVAVCRASGRRLLGKSPRQEQQKPMLKKKSSKRMQSRVTADDEDQDDDSGKWGTLV